jgi:hypothetical protein
MGASAREPLQGRRQLAPDVLHRTLVRRPRVESGQLDVERDRRLHQVHHTEAGIEPHGNHLRVFEGDLRRVAEFGSAKNGVERELHGGSPELSPSAYQRNTCHTLPWRYGYRQAALRPQPGSNPNDREKVRRIVGGASVAVIDFSSGCRGGSRVSPGIGFATDTPPTGARTRLIPLTAASRGDRRIGVFRCEDFRC